MNLSQDQHGIIYRLDPFAKEKGGETFNSGWGNQEHKVYEKVIINSKTVAELEELIQKSLLIKPDDELCGHTPPYGVELYDYGICYFRTSFCFECGNWINYSKGQYHRLYLRNSGLFEKLQEIIPLPKT